MVYDDIVWGGLVILSFRDPWDHSQGVVNNKFDTGVVDSITPYGNDPLPAGTVLPPIRRRHIGSKERPPLKKGNIWPHSFAYFENHLRNSWKA